jgi:hypothetical protein
LGKFLDYFAAQNGWNTDLADEADLHGFILPRKKDGMQIWRMMRICAELFCFAKF